MGYHPSWPHRQGEPVPELVKQQVLLYRQIRVRYECECGKEEEPGLQQGVQVRDLRRPVMLPSKSERKL